MNKLIALLIVVNILPQFLKSQVIEGLPVDENGKINFNEIVEIDSLDKNLLYSNAKQFFVNTFKSANSVIQMDDKENGILIGKGFNDFTFETKYNKKTYSFTNQLWYTVKIQCKDKRYKYEIYDIYFKSPSNVMTITAEENFDIHYIDKTIKTNNLKLNEKQINEMKQSAIQYKSSMLSNVNLLIQSLKTAMLNNKNTDW